MVLVGKKVRKKVKWEKIRIRAVWMTLIEEVSEVRVSVVGLGVELYVVRGKGVGNNVRDGKMKEMVSIIVRNDVLVCKCCLWNMG